MELQLYNTKETINTMNKEKILVDTFEISFKSQTDILTPYIKIYYPEQIELVNYAFIPELNRYYHITNVEPMNNKIVYLQLEVDVLETYKTDILESRKVQFIQKVEPILEIIKSNEPLESEFSYILTTLGKTGDVVVDKDIDVTGGV